MNQIFCVKHWGKGGEGSGSTIVVASRERMAAEFVKAYLLAKPDGYRQFTSINLLEIEPLEDSTFDGECFSTDECGVKAEYWFAPGDEHIPQLIFLGGDVEALASELDELQARQNSGRGVSCVHSICLSLRRGDLSGAKACSNNESDKIRSYPEIVAVLKRVGLWHEIPWLR